MIAVLKPTLFYLKTCLHGLPDRCACSNLVPTSVMAQLVLPFDTNPGDVGSPGRQVPSEVEEWSVFSINVSFMSMVVRGRSTLRDPIRFLPLCAISGLAVPYQGPGKQE